MINFSDARIERFVRAKIWEFTFLCRNKPQKPVVIKFYIFSPLFQKRNKVTSHRESTPDKTGHQCNAFSLLFIVT